MSKVIAIVATIALLAQACVDDTSEKKNAGIVSKKEVASYLLMVGDKYVSVNKEGEQSASMKPIIKDLVIDDERLQENNGVWKSELLKIASIEFIFLEGDTLYSCQKKQGSAVGITFTLDDCNIDDTKVEWAGEGEVIAGSLGGKTSYVLATGGDGTVQRFVFDMSFMATYLPPGTVQVRVRAVDDKLRPLANDCIDIFTSPPGYFDFGQSLDKEDNTVSITKGRKNIMIDWDSKKKMTTGFEYTDGGSVRYVYKREKSSQRNDPKLISEDHFNSLIRGEFCDSASDHN